MTRANVERNELFYANPQAQYRPEDEQGEPAKAQSGRGPAAGDSSESGSNVQVHGGSGQFRSGLGTGKLGSLFCTITLTGEDPPTRVGNLSLFINCERDDGKKPENFGRYDIWAKRARRMKRAWSFFKTRIADFYWSTCWAKTRRRIIGSPKA